MKRPTKHIGIVACTAEGASLCYRTICAEGAALFGPHDHPEISMHTISLAEYMTYIDRDDWAGVGELMLRSANKLSSIGADVMICPDNTIHQSLPYITERSPRPWLHIAEAVAREAHARGFTKLGITGTRWLIGSDVYPQKLREHSIDFVLPDLQERERINQIIMSELVRGKLHDASLHYFQQVIGRMQANGCDAVVLGCTEIPLLMNDGNSPLPTLDSTRLLARAALAYAANT